MSIIVEYGLKKLIDLALKKAVNLLNKDNLKFHSSKNDIINAFTFQFTDILSWSSNVSFKFLNGTRSLKDVYTPLSLTSQMSTELFPDRNAVKFGINSAISRFDKIILMGKPGSGKTTTLQSIAFNFIHQEDFLPDYFSCPILIRLKEFSDAPSNIQYDSILNYLADNFNLNISWKENVNHTGNLFQIRNKMIIDLLNELKIVLLLDGLDEVPTITLKEKIIKEITYISRFSTSKIVVTTRTADYEFTIPDAVKLEVSNLSKEEIALFIENWLNNKDEAEKLKDKIFNSNILGAETRPLTLAHLCLIYQRLGDIPKNKKDVYEKLTNLMIEDWDIERLIKRESKFDKFQPLKKKVFLISLAYNLTTRFHRSSYFRLSDIQLVYDLIYAKYNLPQDELELILEELEYHCGLFNKKRGSYFEFYHKSVQEYFTALYLTGLPEIPRNEDILIFLYNELAVAISISTDASAYFSFLILNRFKSKQFFYQTFLNPFLERIILENPEFDVSPLLRLSFLKIYNEVIHLKSDKISSEKNFPETIKMFHSFHNHYNNIINDSLSELKKYYSISQINESRVKLVKKKTINEYHSGVEPKILYTTFDFYHLLI